MDYNPKSRLRRDTPTPRNGGVVFWMLMLLAFGAFTPCVLLPEWRQYQTLCREEQVQRHRAEALAEQVEEQHRLLMALRSDPAVVARLAQREYRFRRPGDQVVPVSVVGNVDVSVKARPFVPEPVPLPPPFARAASHLPTYDYDRIFCDDETRPIIMAMSVGLIVLTLWLFGRQGEDADTTGFESGRAA